MAHSKKFFLLFFFLLVLNLSAQSTFYVDPVNGNDSNSGTIDQPFKTISKGISALTSSGTIYLRGGTYLLSNYVKPSKSGTASGYFNLWAYPGEKPVLDFSGESLGTRGIYLTVSYWNIKGLEIKNAGDNGVYIQGGFNTIENCSIHDNKDSGLQISGGGHDNRVINCDSYYNADPPDYGDADGFSPKMDVGDNNYFYGCRSWNNCDDGWDGYLRGANNVTTTLENCWTWKNGYLKDGTDPGPQANGNGFKMGGSDNKDLMHNFVLKNCLSFDNKVKGFDQNSNKGSMTLYNCTGFRNGTYNYSITTTVSAGKSVTIKNSISLASTGVALMGSVIQQNNSWSPGFSVSNIDFQSIDPSSAYGPRKPDGSLPDIEFMHLQPGSNLVDTGVNVGIPFTGIAPDLGAFEYGMTMPTNVESSNQIPDEFLLEQNYPNPFNPVTTISYQIPADGHVELKVFDLLGREVASLVNSDQAKGKYRIKFDGSNFSSGIYFYQLRTSNFVGTKKLLILK